VAATKKGGRIAALQLRAKLAYPIANGAGSELQSLGDFHRRIFIDEHSP
jgi:hypothetical protein